MNRFSLALRLLWRDRRSGELTLLLAALIIAVTSSSAIALFSDRLQRSMTVQTAEFLAADLVIATAHAIPENWLEMAAALKLTTARTVEFSSVLLEHGEMLLASIKAVSPGYPLRGELKITRGDGQPEVVRHGPEPGEAWVERRVLSALQLELGDALTVGEKTFKVTRLITYEPDKQGDFYSFSPRVMINDTDLAATRAIQPGSHVHYFFQFVGPAQVLADYKQWLRPRLTAGQRIMDIRDDRPELGSALDRAQRYLGLSSLLVVVIAGVAIAMATRRYGERHFDGIALLRCLGLKQHEMLWLFAYQFMLLGLAGSAAGCLLGWFAHGGLFLLLGNLLPQTVAQPGPAALLFGFIIGFAMLLGFALPPLLRLRQVSPLRVLRRELEPLPASGWIVYGLALAVTGVLVWQYSNDAKLTVTLLVSGLLAVFMLGLMIYGLLGLIHHGLPKFSLAWRFGLQGLVRNRRGSVNQVLAFSLTLVAMLLSLGIRNDLLDDWQRQLPGHAANHFALNIFPGQLASFQQALQAQAPESNRFYPVARGRLVAINQTPVQKITIKDSQAEMATHRELSLTWAELLPEDNQLVRGRWWVDKRTHLVSVEQKLADTLKIQLGDELTFTIGSQSLKAVVTSFRALRWDTMKPNFYMIFSPGTLTEFPSTYLTSFYLPKEQKQRLNGLAKQFPNVTFLEVDAIVQQFKTILRQLTAAINYLLYFALAAGFTVLFAAVYASLDARIHESALLRTLGANHRLLTTAHLIEFGGLGFIAGLLAVLMAETITYALYTHVMLIAYQPKWWLWLAVPALGGISVAVAGWWGLKDVLAKPPLQVLREL